MGDDHWKQKQYQFQDAHRAQQDPQNEEADTLISAVRDLASSASVHYVKGTSAATLGSVLGSVINSQKACETKLDKAEQATPSSITSSELTERMGPMFLSPGVATQLLDGWMKHFSTRYPIIHSHSLRELHSRRDDDLDFYETSLLHLVYANSGRFLETVSIQQLPTAKSFLLTLSRQEKAASFSLISIMKLHCNIWTLSYSFTILAL